MTDICTNTLDKTEDLPIVWIKNNESLERLLDEIADCQEVALDTEFIKRETYYPILALIQINTGTAIYLLDAPKLELTEFWQVLAKLPVMIWHACGEDLTIFYLLSDLPVLDNVFDTQIAMAFLSGQLQMGYQQSIHQELGIHLDKAHSRSDWLIRPLSDEQEQYAIDDVRYLLPLYQRLKQKLAELGFTDWVWQDCQTYANKIYQSTHMDDDRQYLSSADFKQTGQQLWMLRELLSWRERLARAKNQPRTFILRKQGIRELAEQMPTSMRQLGRTSIHRTIIGMYGEEILKVIRQSNKVDKDEYPQPITPPYRSKDKTLTKQVNRCIEAHAEQINIPANVLMKKKWIFRLFQIVALHESLDAIQDNLPEGLQGWRLEFVLQQLVPLLQANLADIRAGIGLSQSA